MGLVKLRVKRKYLTSSGWIITPGEVGENNKINVHYITISSYGDNTDVDVHFGESPSEDDYVAGGYFSSMGGLHEAYGEKHFLSGGMGEGLYCTLTSGGPVKIYVKYTFG